jgi:hypothetical protein
MEKLTEREIMINFANGNPNNGMLGAKWRKNVIDYKGRLDELCLKFPNDYDLGAEIRKIIKNNN